MDEILFPKGIFMKKLLFTALLALSILTLLSCGSKKNEPVPSTTDYLPTERPQQTLATDYTAPDFPDVGLYINYSPNNSKAGTVEGGGTVRVDLKPAGTVTAKANLGYRFVEWSDGVKEATRSGDTVTESCQIIAIFDYAPLELPILHIDTETGGDVRSKTEYIGATLSVSNTDAEYYLDGLDMQIRGRGNKTWEYEKKSYKLKLSEKQSLLGLGEGKAKKWVLLANVCDQSLLRNYVALLMAGAMPSGVWSPASTSVEVYLNGSYHGVYLLCEEIDVNKNKVNIPEDLTGAGSKDIGFLVEISGNPKSPSFKCNDRSYQIHSDLSTDAGEAYEQQLFIEEYIRSAWDAVCAGNKDEIAKLIDLDSMVSAYLVEEIMKNLDCGYDSFYLYRQPGGKLTFGPLWDFDNALGNADEGTENYYDLYVAYDERFQSNPWLYTAMEQDWFRTRVVKMWDDTKSVREMMAPTVLSAGKAGYNSFCRNFARWNLFGRTWNRETEQITSLKTYTAHYEFLAQWINQRLDWLDECYHEQSFLTEWEVSEKPSTGGGWGGWERPEETEDENKPPLVAEGIGNDAAQTLLDGYTYLPVQNESVIATVEGNWDEWATCLFDQDTNTKYCAAIGTGGGWWGEPTEPGMTEIIFSLEKAAAIEGYIFTTANDTAKYPTRNPTSWMLFGQNEQGEWIQIDASTKEELGMSGYNYTAYGKSVENAPVYQTYKLEITHAGTLQLSEVSLFTK